MATWSTERLIDDVAHAMTNDAAGLDLRSAVLARIERRRLWRTAWVVVPIAAAALVGIALGLRQPDARSASTAGVPATAQTAALTALDTPAVRVPGRPAPAAAATRPTPMTALPHVRTIAALAGPVRLSAPSIQPNALAIPLLDVKPIVTEPLAMSAIDDGPAPGRQPRFE